MSREREALYQMIEEREAVAYAKHRLSDDYYNWYDTAAWEKGVSALHTEIRKLYDEILLLKMVLMKADELDNSGDNYDDGL